MRKRIFRFALALILALFIAFGLIMTAGMYGLEASRARTDLMEETRLLASLLGTGDEAQTLRAAVTTRRVTLIASDGAVLFDSEASAELMSNHIDREEVAQALSAGEAATVRRSDTLSRELLYCALLLPSGDVLRLAAPQKSFWGHVSDSLPWLLGALALCALAMLAASRVITNKLVAPITSIDPDEPLEGDCYEELTPLLRRLHAQREQNNEQLESLRAQRRSTDALLSSMREGLVMLDKEGRVITLNRSAADILGVGREDIDGAAGRPLLELNRSAALQALLGSARQSGEAAGSARLNSRHYHISASLVGDGLLLLLQDDTAESEAEEMRRRFTANVSHELRTPLTAISGYAELIESGMAKREDEADFISRIRREAARMLALVEDIMRLSQLDEGSAAVELADVDVYAAAEDVMLSLADKAKAHGVGLTLSGERAQARLDSTLLGEIIYNLLDNAIKYNREGGEAAITVEKRANGVRLCVSDTGIGIPPEHQGKVFERFYRVDKSRSKAIGGTGLGLSIVKHAALLLGAEVRLESEPGVGTRVTVDFI